MFILLNQIKQESLFNTCLKLAEITVTLFICLSDSSERENKLKNISRVWHTFSVCPLFQVEKQKTKLSYSRETQTAFKKCVKHSKDWTEKRSWGIILWERMMGTACTVYSEHFLLLLGWNWGQFFNLFLRPIKSQWNATWLLMIVHCHTYLSYLD